MPRFLHILVVFAVIASTRAAEDLPRKGSGEAMDFEPDLLPGPAYAPDPIETAPRLEAAIERAKKSAAAGERMFRAGIIAKVEAEKRVLKVVRLTSELAAAKLETAKTELETKRADFDAGKLSQEQLAAAQASTEATSQAASAAASAWQRAELAAAELQLARQRQLLAAGIGSKSLVSRAQSQVAGLKSKTSAPPTPAR